MKVKVYHICKFLQNFGRFYRRATATTGVSMKGFNQKRDCQKYYL